MRRVDPKHYTKEYYLTGCTGHEEFLESDGNKLEPRLQRIVEEVKHVKNKKILDIGCGRGETVCWSAKNGAKEAIGIDYSISAVRLANSARKKWLPEIKNKTKFKVMDAKKLNYKDRTFDVIFLIEVVEHLYPEELIEVMKDAKRVLKDDGILVVHTAPSRFFYDFTYRFWCYPISTMIVKINNFLTDGNYPNIARYEELRNETDELLHVNEPNYYSLKKLFNKTGFMGEIKSTNLTIAKPLLSWKDKFFNFMVYLNPLSYKFPFNVIWGNDFLSVLKKK